MDKVWVHTTQDYATQTIHLIKKNFNLSGAKIKYSSSSGAVTALSSRALFMWLFLGDGTVSDNTAQVTAMRMWYTDK